MRGRFMHPMPPMMFRGRGFRGFSRPPYFGRNQFGPELYHAYYANQFYGPPEPNPMMFDPNFNPYAQYGPHSDADSLDSDYEDRKKAKEKGSKKKKSKKKKKKKDKKKDKRKKKRKNKDESDSSSDSDAESSTDSLSFLDSDNSSTKSKPKKKKKKKSKKKKRSKKSDDSSVSDLSASELAVLDSDDLDICLHRWLTNCNRN